MGSHRGVDLTKLRKRKFQGGGGSGGGGQWYKYTGYDTPRVIRVLPPRADFSGDFWAETAMHYNGFGAKGSAFVFEGIEQKKAIICNRFHEEAKQGDCPVCEILDWASENQEKQVLKALRKQSVYKINIVDRDDNNRIKIWDCKPSVIGAIDAIMKGSMGDVTNPRVGRDLEITRTGDPNEISSIEYHVQALDKSPIGVADWESKDYDLMKMIRESFQSRQAQLAALYTSIAGLVPLDEIFGKRTVKVRVAASVPRKKPVTKTKTKTKKGGRKK